MDIEVFDLKLLKKYIKNKKLYLVFGNDYLQQYASLTELNNTIKKMSKEISKDSIIFYFGEKSDIDNPDIGYVMEELYNRRNDLDFIMIEQEKNESYPKFINKVFKLDIKTTKKRGVNNNNKKPLGITKFWTDINKSTEIDTIYILGGNEIIMEEMELIKELDINYKYYPLKRKFNNDGKTIIKKSASINDKVGPTFILNKTDDDII
tara:strand:+ start:639 stop:1259 length:621 start_codon:yes stop_codon:yes gene_type:complete